MSHRKVHSQGSIPFSWEYSPGISKFAPRRNSVEKTPDSVRALVVNSNDQYSWVRDPKIPLPPGTAQPPKRNGSVRARFRRVQDDPFLAAYKECTRSRGDVDVTTKARHREDEAGYKKGMFSKKGLFMFSCKSSCDVREKNNFVRKLSNDVPPLPLTSESTRGKSISLAAGKAITSQELDINPKLVAQLNPFWNSLRNDPLGKIGLSLRRCPHTCSVVPTKTFHVLGDPPRRSLAEPCTTEHNIEEACQSLAFCATETSSSLQLVARHAQPNLSQILRCNVSNVSHNKAESFEPTVSSTKSFTDDPAFYSSCNLSCENPRLESAHYTLPRSHLCV